MDPQSCGEEQKKLKTKINMIERVHQVSLHQDSSFNMGFGFKLPKQMFKLKIPTFVKIGVSSSQLLQNTYGN